MANNKSFWVMLLNLVFWILIYSKDDKPAKMEVKFAVLLLSKLRPDISRTFKLSHAVNIFEKYSSEDVLKLVKFRNSNDLHPPNILDMSFKTGVLKSEILIDINDLQL